LRILWIGTHLKLTSSHLHTPTSRRLQVHVQLQPVGEVYEVTFEVAEDADGPARRDASTQLSLHWGLHRESLDEWMCLPDLPPGSEFNESTSATRWGGASPNVLKAPGFSA